MTGLSSYQPFLIGQGNSKTGLFTYLESWTKPEDAYDTLVNAYVYRGSTYQRSGMTLYQSAAGNGALVYLDSLQIATGDGGASYTYTFLKLPLIAGTVIVSCRVMGEVRTMTDDGAGGFTGTLDDGTSTIDYVTGDLVLNASDTINAGRQIWAQFGYVPTQITTGTNEYNPIMGIKQYIKSTDGSLITIVFDTRRASYYDSSGKTFVGLNQFSQPIYQQFATDTSFSALTTQWTDLARYTVVVTDSLGNSMIDNGGGNFFNLSGAGFDFAASSVIYASGVINVVYNAAPAIGTIGTVTAKVSGDYFTGDNTNFFNATNWSFSEVWGDNLYATNNVDPITLFNGTQLGRPLFNTTLESVKDFAYVDNDTIATCLDIKVYKNRLQLLRTTLLNASTTESQNIRYSIQQQPTATQDIVYSPFNFAADFSGNGGFVTAPTGDWLMASQLLRDSLIVFFQNSTFLYRFTGSAFDPYRFDQINATRQTSAPYGTVAYDIQCTSMGAKGLIYCDGTAVDRYDISVIDIFEDINQSAFAQCFAQRYDPDNLTWMLYPQQPSITSDKALIYNFLESIWSIYAFNIGTLSDDPTTNNTMSCLGLGLNVEDITWEDFAPGSDSAVEGLSWSQSNFPWIGFATQTLSPVLLGGDQDGKVYLMNSGVTDNTNAVQTLIQTKRLNPFVSTGEKARFGYLDIYYEINSQITLSVNFYLNNSQDVSKSTTFTLDAVNGDTTSIWNWKRIYLNMVGQFIQIELTNETPNDSGSFNTGGTFKILGMILHAAPAGRFTPGVFQ